MGVFSRWSLISWAATIASALLIIAVIGGPVQAKEGQPDKAQAEQAAPDEVKAGEDSSDGKKSGGESASSDSSSSGRSKYASILKDAKLIDGLVKLHRKGGTTYAELSPSQLNRDFIVIISLARGIGRDRLLSGMSWGFGDDWIWQFRKVDDRIHVVRRNVRFTAAKGSPEAKAVKLAFTDSVLFSLPIAANGPGGSYVIDLNPIFMSDLPQISQALPGFSFSPQRSTWAAVKGFKDNIELQVAGTYASNGQRDIDTVPDSRGATINIHYSISYLPQNGYKPRLADDRVGYFLTVLKDYSAKNLDDDRFVRYINRWHLEKADPSAELSPPKKPIIFWLEKTVPYKYRAAIRDGIEEWNKAFEKAGFVNAIEVRQQPDNADWDPEDINYNTFRWITPSNEGAFAMGPSRVNPTTGEILDADIIFDGDFLQSWKTEYETFTPQSVAAMTGGPLDLESYKSHIASRDFENGFCPECQLSHGRSMDFALGGLSLMARGPGRLTEQEKEKMIMQGLKEVTMHEVGHTLGLRHNFKASGYLTLEEMEDPKKVEEVGFTASVMDYTPTYIAPKGKKQHYFYSQTIGPYDMWAIEYGYKPISASSPEGERKELDKIASRSGEPALQYLTDEDTRGIDSDPLSNRFDLGADTVAFARYRAELISELWPTIVDRTVKDGESYQRARQAFGMMLSQYGRAMHFASRYIGGINVSRSHRGDTKDVVPLQVVSAEKQREALDLLSEHVFSEEPFQLPTELYGYLVATRWNHWGTRVPLRTDFPVHDAISVWQFRILDQLLSSLTLERLHDSELKVPADEDAFTTAELIHGLTTSIFSEVESLREGEFTNRKPAISSIRRNLQRELLNRLSKLALGETSSPQDCQTIAFAELAGVRDRMDKLLKADVKLDDYTRAHLMESSARIGKVLDAHLEMRIQGASSPRIGFHR